MTNTFHSYPLLRPLASLTAGILLADLFPVLSGLHWWHLVPFPFLLILAHRYYNIKTSGIFGSFSMLFFLLLGIIVFHQHNPPISLPRSENYIGTFTENPQERNKSYKAILLAHPCSIDSSYKGNSERILVYFEKDSMIQKVQAGEKIIFKAQVRTITSQGNPFEFDFGKYMNRNGVYHQAYIKRNQWKKVQGENSPKLGIRSYNLKIKLLSRFETPHFSPESTEILSALTLGYKAHLTQETRMVFSSAGAMHILAVSGLHVGIIYWIISSMLFFLKRWKHGRVLLVFLCLSGLWAYAYISGLSPSVVRATMMFSLFGIGRSLRRKANVYNTLALSAFLMLLANPNHLFMVGFQLSYAAVFGIVYLQPFMSKWVHSRFRIITYLWGLFSVSVSAQLATLPFCLFYFQQFPSYFWISNLIVVPLVFVLVPTGLIYIVLASDTFLGSEIAYLLDKAVTYMFLTLKKIEDLPGSSPEIFLRQHDFILLLILIAFLFLYISNKKAGYILGILSIVFILLLSSITVYLNQHSSFQFIVYNHVPNPTIHFIDGKYNYVLSKHAIQKESREEQLILRTCRNLRLESPVYHILTDSVQCSHFSYQNGLALFGSKLFVIDQALFAKSDHEIEAFKYISNGTAMPIHGSKEAIHYISTTYPVSNKTTRSQSIYYTTEKGAYYEKW